MFDEFGPRGAEDEREGFWTDLSEVPDEQHRDEDEPKQTQEVIVPPAQEPYGGGSCRCRRRMRGELAEAARTRGDIASSPLVRPRAGPRPPSPTGEGTYIYTF